MKPKITKYEILVFVSFSALLCYLISVLYYVTDVGKNKCLMTYMYEYPQFVVSSIAASRFTKLEFLCFTIIISFNPSKCVRFEYGIMISLTSYILSVDNFLFLKSGHFLIWHRSLTGMIATYFISVKTTFHISFDFSTGKPQVQLLFHAGNYISLMYLY